MAKIQLKASLLSDTTSDDAEETELISTEETGSSRWANIYTMVFKYDGKFYQTDYRQGTGDSGEAPYEHYEEDDLIECVEVEPYEVTITKYRPIIE